MQLRTYTPQKGDDLWAVEVCRLFVAVNDPLKVWVDHLVDAMNAVPPDERTVLAVLNAPAPIQRKIVTPEKLTDMTEWFNARRSPDTKEEVKALRRAVTNLRSAVNTTRALIRAETGFDDKVLEGIAAGKAA